MISTLRIHLFLWVILWLGAATSWGQQAADFSIDGYVRVMQNTTLRSKLFSPGDGLLHNRINVRGYLNDHWNVELGLRNRILWGTTPKTIPNYGAFLNQDGLDLNLGGAWWEGKGAVGHSTFDRLFIAYRSDQWRIALGRQRINWGKNIIWNPNDVFNAYNFFDFDYAERPGTDALSVQYFLSGSALVEFATNGTKRFDENTSMVRYAFNKNQYDWQFIMGKYKRDFVLGVGWEGVLKSVGFKGEASYFMGAESAFNASLSFDYYLKNGLYVLISSLYNQKGFTSNETDPFSNFSGYRLNVKQLMPNQNTVLLQLSKALAVQSSLSLTTLYAHELKGWILVPQWGYSLGQNWQLDCVGQFFYFNAQTASSSATELLFLRMAYNF